MVGLALLALPGNANANGGNSLPQQQANVPWSSGVTLAQKTQAVQLYREAKANTRKSFLLSALEQYRQAIELWPHPALYYNAAMVGIRAGLKAEAYEDLKRAMAHGSKPLSEDPDEAWTRFAEAEKWLKKLASQLTEIEIVCNEPGAQVFFREKHLFTGPGRHRSRVTVGLYSLIAAKDGYQSDVRQGVLSPQKKTLFELVLSYRATVRHLHKRAVWVPAGIGLLSTVVAGVLHWRSTVHFGRFDDMVSAHCPGEEGCRPDDDIRTDIDRQRMAGQRYRSAAGAAYVVSAISFVAAAALLRINRERQVMRESRPARTGLTIAPHVSAGNIGLVAGIDF